MARAGQSSSDPEVLQPFGKYLLDAELAQGGMARVFRARLRGPGGFEKRLVVKQILQELASDPAFVELFVREANTLVQMSHPNVVPVYELGVVDGVYFLAMELVEGATVAELLRDGPLSEPLCAHIGAQVCEALRYAHDRFGLVHRDVTPRNVIADADGHVRLLDFGIAAPLARTGDGGLFGSPGYMSPEQRRGGALSAQSDLFSLGSVLYEALTGRPALGRGEHDVGEIGPIEGVSAELDALVRALLAPDPAARPGSAAEVARRLRAWLSQRHPEGVARTLATRVEQARARVEPEPTAGTPVRIESRPNATPRLTRSIATSKQLSELLGGSTEPLARAPAAPELPEEVPAPSPAARPRSRTALALVLAAAALALGASALVLQRGAGKEVSARVTSSVRDRPVAPSATPAARNRPAHAVAAGTGAAAGARAPDPMLDAPRPTEVKSDARSVLAPASGRARLSVNALPWAELRLDGRALGTTPQRALATSAGNHVLLLECPPLGRRARVPLKLAADEHRHVLVDLNADPPAVTLR